MLCKTAVLEKGLHAIANASKGGREEEWVASHAIWTKAA